MMESLRKEKKVNKKKEFSAYTIHSSVLLQLFQPSIAVNVHLIENKCPLVDVQNLEQQR